MPDVPPLAIGSDVWPGLAKVAEECGELQQVIGKLIAYPDEVHPDRDGPLLDRLQDELGDVVGAINFVVAVNDRIDGKRHVERASTKFGRFLGWHHAEAPQHNHDAIGVYAGCPACGTDALEDK